MLDSNQVKEKLSTDDIIKLCCELQEDDTVLYDSQGHPIFCTCLDHKGGTSWKTYYYPDTKTFHTYTSGESKDIFQVVQQVKELDNFRDAFTYVVNYFNLKDTGPTERVELTNDWDIFQQLIDFREPTEEQNTEVVKVVNENMLEYFYPLAAPTEWQKDGISPAVMYYYGIRIDSALHHIIIPQRIITGDLVGIRRRSFDQFEIDAGKKYMPVFIEGDVYATPTSKTLFGIYENKETIKKLKKVLLVEGEKSVMQLATMYGQSNCWALATYGSSLSSDHIQLLLNLGVEEVVLAYDHEFEGRRGEASEMAYEEKLIKLIKPLLPYMKVSLILDTEDLTPYKASPTDCGREVFEKLYHSRIPVNSVENKLLFREQRRKK